MSVEVEGHRKLLTAVYGRYGANDHGPHIRKRIGGYRIIDGRKTTDDFKYVEPVALYDVG